MERERVKSLEVNILDGNGRVIMSLRLFLVCQSLG
jgi:hypothetical protein